MKGGFKDPLRAALLQRGAFSGVKGLGRFVPVSLEERDQLIKRLERDDKDMVCESCGSTKPLDFYKANGAISCCPDRKMVASSALLEEMAMHRAKPSINGLLKALRTFERAETEYRRAQQVEDQTRLNRAGTAYVCARSKVLRLAGIVRKGAA